MWPYFMPIIFIFFMNLVTQRDIRAVCGRKIIYTNRLFLMLGVLFVFAALRGNGSGDYFAYLRMGKNITDFKKIFHNNIHMDTGYCFLAWVVNLLHLPSQSVIAFMNAISIGAIGIMIKRYSKFQALSVLIFLPFYFQFDMHAARTACAIAILTLSVPYILKRDLKRFILVLFGAVLFHPEAAIGVFLYFLPSFVVDLRSAILLLSIDMVISIFNLSDKLVLFLLDGLGIQSIYYRFLSYTQKSNPMSYASSFYDPRLFVALLVFLYAKISKIETDRFGRFLVNSSFVNALLMIFFNNHAVFTYRLSSFYGIFSIILIPYIFQKTREKQLDVGMKKQYEKIRYLVTIFYAVFAAAYAIQVSVPYTLCQISYW